MDINILATAAISLLTPYLIKGAEKFAEMGGEAAAHKVGELYQAVKKKFKGDAYAEQTLARAAEQPEAADRRAALQGVLKEKLEADAAFAETLQKLTAESEAHGAGDVQVAIAGEGAAVGQAAHNSEVRINYNQPQK